MKRIIVACDTLEIGGAETFAIRMARYYRERGHQVWLLSVLGDRINHKLIRANAGDIPVVSYRPAGVLNWLLYKLDGLLYRLGKFDGLRRHLTIRKFRRFVLENKVDVVHTNMFAALDTLNAAVKDIPAVCSIHSVHGDIIDLAYQEVSGKTLNPLARFQSGKLLPSILTRVDHVVCIAEMHMTIFQAWKRIGIEKLCKIYNPVDIAADTESITREELGIPDRAFVFGSMARCVKEKGWGELIEAFLRTEIEDAYLVLIGDGAYMPTLKERFGNHRNVIFLGAKPSPWKYVRLFDVAVSPSYFWESLPTVIIEYLSLAKPVIVTDNAESRYMIEGPQGMAGRVVPLNKDKWEVIQGEAPLDVADLAEALQEMHRDSGFRQRAISNTAACYARYDKDLIVGKYEALFMD